MKKVTFEVHIMRTSGTASGPHQLNCWYVLTDFDTIEEAQSRKIRFDSVPSVYEYSSKIVKVTKENV